MRDELNVVIAFTLALKFAFIVTPAGRQLNFLLLSSGHLATPRYVIGKKSSLLPGNVLRFDVSTTYIGWGVAHRFADTDRMVCTWYHQSTFPWPFHMLSLLRH
jgi:hypothetical protein